MPPGKPYGVMNPMTANLDVGGYSIISLADGNITLAPDGIGHVVLDSHTWPNYEGLAGQALVTDGAGTCVWLTVCHNPMSADLNVAGWSFITLNNGDITLAPHGTGNTVISNGQLLLSGVVSKGMGALELKPHLGNASVIVIQESGDVGGMSLNAGSGYSGIALGAYYDNTNWKVLSSGVYLVYKSPTEAVFYGEAGLTPGNTWSPSILGRTDLATGSVTLGGVGMPSPRAALDLVRTSDAVSGLIAGFPTFRILNPQTTTFSFAGMLVAADNGDTSFSLYVDGLGNGGIIGEKGAYVGMSTNHPLWWMTNNIKRLGILADGTLSIPFNNQSILIGASGDVTMLYNGTDFVLDVGLIAASDFVVDCGTGKTLKLAEGVWDDLVIPLAGARVPAVNDPSWVAFSANLNSYTFAIDDYADLATTEVLHSWEEGTDLEIHIHFITDGANDGTERKVQYQVFYDIGDIGEVMAGEANGSGEETIPASEADRMHHYLDIVTITGTNYKIGANIKMRVKRIAGTGVEPANDPFVEMIGIHYKQDTMGSRTEAAK